MEDRDLAFTPALEQAAMLRRGEISSAELVECYLARIERLNPAINSYVTVAADLARAVARDADAALRDGKTADALPPFLGVPISIKDLARHRGHSSARTAPRSGTTAFPEHDDEVVARCRRGGFVFLGKTIVPEFGPLNISEPPGVPAGAQPVGSRALVWWVVGWSRRGGRRRAVPGVARIRRWRLDPQPVVVVRRVRDQAAARSRVGRARTRSSSSRSDGPIARNVADAAALLDVMAGSRDGRRVVGAAASNGRSSTRSGETRGGCASRTTRTRVSTPTRARPRTVRRPRTPRGCSSRSATKWRRSHRPGTPKTWSSRPPTIFAAQHAAAADQVPYPPLETLDPWMQHARGDGRSRRCGRLREGDATRSRRCRVGRSRSSTSTTCSCRRPLPLPPPVVGRWPTPASSDMMEFWALTPFTALWNTTGQPAVSLPLADRRARSARSACRSSVVPRPRPPWCESRPCSSPSAPGAAGAHQSPDRIDAWRSSPF